jgi:hypothetical protein
MAAKTMVVFRHAERCWEGTMAWQVSPVQDTQDSRGNFAGSGFNIVDATTMRPVVTFGFLKPAEAEKARKLIADAPKDAVLVSAHA